VTRSSTYFGPLLALSLLLSSLYAAAAPALADDGDSEEVSEIETAENSGEDSRGSLGNTTADPDSLSRDPVVLGEVGLGVITTGNSIPADPATEPDPSRGSGAGAAETVAADLEPPCVARDGGSGSPAGDAGSLSADELAARGIGSTAATQNLLDAVVEAGAGASTSPSNDGANEAGASSQASGDGLKDTAYVPVVVAAKPVKSSSFWQDGDAESAPSTLESNTSAVLDIWREYPRGTRTKTRPAAA